MQRLKNDRSTKPAQKPKLWTANYILACLSSLVIMTAFSALVPILPIYIEQYSNIPGMAGLPLALLTIGAVAVRPLAGRALDIYNRKTILLAGFLLFLLPVILFIGMLPAVVLIFLRLVQGIGWGFGNTALSTVAADVIPPKRMGEGLGYFTITVNAALAYAPAVSLFILDRYNFSILFTLLALLVLAAIALAAMINYSSPVSAPAGTRHKPVFLDRAAFKPALIMLFFTSHNAAVASFIAIHAAQKGVANSWVLYTATALAVIAVRPFTGKIVDKQDQRRIDFTVVLGSVTVMGASLILAETASPAHLVAGGILSGMGQGIIMPVMLALSVRNAAPEKRGAANATYWTAYDLGVALGSMIWGLVGAAFGYYMMYNLTTLPIAAALLIYFLWK